MNNGFINIHRKILDNPIAKKPHWAWLWVYILLRANWKETEIIWNGELRKIEKGSFITGRNSLAKDIGIPPSTIEDILKYLETQHQIRQQKNNKYRVITVLNWEKYQNSDNKSDNQPTSSRHLADTDNNINKDNKDNKDTSEVPSQDIVSIIDSFKEVNQSAGKWYKNITQREAIKRLIKAQTLEKVIGVIKILPKTNTMPYIPTITTPLQLEEKWSQLESALIKKKNEQLSKQPLIII